jgi:GNAT superfamily N-acetyltransferase
MLIEELPIFKRSAFAAFTFPYYQGLLLTPSLAVRSTCAGVSCDGRPIGLALIENQARDCGNLRSIWIEPEYRRQGIARQLLQQVEEMVVARGRRRLETVYMDTLPEVNAFESLLRGAGWESPHTRMYVLQSDLAHINQAGWMKNPPILEPEYELRPWEEVSAAEKKAVAALRIYSKEVWPENSGSNYDRPTSMAIRKGGELVGWIVNHPYAPGVLRFTCSYLRDDLQGRGRMVAVMAESVRRMGPAGYHRGIWAVPMEFPRMVAFSKRRLFPFATEISETRGSGKQL